MAQRLCRYVRGDQPCTRPAKRGWTTCPQHYSAGRRIEPEGRDKPVDKKRRDG